MPESILVLIQKFIVSYLRYHDNHKKVQGIFTIFSALFMAKEESVLIFLAFEIFLIIKMMDREAEVAAMVDRVT